MIIVFSCVSFQLTVIQSQNRYAVDFLWKSD